MSALGRIAAASFGFAPRCAKCGTAVDGSWEDATPYCVTCCPEHDFRPHDIQGHRCAHCFAAPTADWYDLES